MDTFSHGSLTFEVTDDGPSTGEVVILLHGFPQDRTLWDHISPRLNEAGYRTLAPNQRGYTPGATPKSRFDYGINGLSDDILALADAAGAEHFHVVGHDWGGTVAWSLAQGHPERVRTLTALSTPHPAALSWSFTHSDQLLLSWYMGLFQLPLVPEHGFHPRLRRFYRDSGLSQEQAEHYASRFPTPGSLTGPLGWYRSMLTGPVLMGALPGRQSARVNVSLPTTYLWGNNDLALGRAAALKTADFVTGDYAFEELDAGHWLPDTEPEKVIAAVLSRLDSVKHQGAAANPEDPSIEQ